MLGEAEPKVGDVWLLDFEPRIGREQGGVRPALIISNDEFNAIPNELHIVVPMTSRNRNLAYHVTIEPPEGGLTKTSFVMCEQARSQSIKRFLKRRGSVSIEILNQVQQIVGTFIDR